MGAAACERAVNSVIVVTFEKGFGRRRNGGTTQVDTTAHDLKILSICYYVQAGVLAFYSLIMLGYSVFVVTLLKMIQQSPQVREGELPSWVTSFLSLILLGMFVVCLGFGICQFLTGRWLTRHQCRLFCQIVAGLGCLAIPYGTVLGIFTFVVLNRPEARRLFGGAQPQWAPPAPPPSQ